MAPPCARPYACPICGESFMKWSLCLNHVRGSVPCRAALGDALNDLDQLQEACRIAARGAPADAQGSPFAAHGAASPASGASAAGGTAAVVAPASASASVAGAGAGASAGATAGSAAGAQALPQAVPAGLVQPASMEHGPGLTQAAKRLLAKAWRRGFVSQAALATYAADSELAAARGDVQVATLKKFLSPGLREFRMIADQKAWLSRCLTFCSKTTNRPAQAEPLVMALADQALLTNALPQAHWDRFLNLSAEVQQCVVHAVRCSIFANATGELADFFESICYNERAIYIRDAAGVPQVADVQQVKWEAVDGKPYQRLMQHMVFTHGTEERVLRELVDIDLSISPGAAGSLLHDHLATADARRQGTAEVLSLLHAAANCGLVRVCARLVAEGLDVNERAGQSGVAPLHLAVSRGHCHVIRLLLGKRADPNVRDGEGNTPLHAAITAAAQCAEEARDETLGCAAVTHHSLQFRACSLLLEAGAASALASSGDEAESRTPEQLALEHRLFDMYNLCLLHARIRAMRARHPSVDGTALAELLRLRYETACLVLDLFDRIAPSNPDAVNTELRAIIASEFVQERDRIQAMGNRLGRHLPVLKEQAVAALVRLPPDAAKLALQLWRVEEVGPGLYDLPVQLNSAPPPPPPLPEAEGGLPAPPSEIGAPADAQKDTSTSAPATGDEATASTAAEEDASRAPPPPPPVEDADPFFEGRVRKWDEERGFGFIVQDSMNGVEGRKDIFVHRKRIVGSGPGNHIDLRENGRVRFRVAEKDGRPQAMEVIMIDGAGQALSVHGLPPTENAVADGDAGQAGTLDAAEENEEEGGSGMDVTKQFLRHLRRPDVREVAVEKRAEVESWLRCVGLKRQPSGRRDDAMWRREIERRIDFFLERGRTPLQKKDFDFRVRRFLAEICLHFSVVRVGEALAMVEAMTTGKDRDNVRSWPAYLATLLKRFDPRLHEILTERDKRSRTGEWRDRETAESNGAEGETVRKNGGANDNVSSAPPGLGAGGSGSSRHSSPASVRSGKEEDKAPEPAVVNSEPPKRAWQ
eukprot:TRINITY_DN29236_c1_g3_i1.p1 TRINITY_DN29236_c1_g3~~TRINITY_DN29236_c1_g3_i1.p1  ORF type:complete len:1045 (+),score=198.90 TRINITY_DN29236_c1_g3_i1:57-3191(+)